jgi:predicted TIM-barrel fold metal-dependent hydrolase
VWLDEHNQYGRWYGSISVSTKTPDLSAREIERWAGHPHMAEVLISPQMPFHLGDTRMDPIYAAAARHHLPVVTHLFSLGPYEITPIYPVGMPAHWNDFFAGYPLVFASHLMSLIFDGTFERHPELRFVFVEGAFTWAMPVIWRMDKIWEARRRDLPLVRRRPSDYVRDHVFFTTQPIETPERGGDLKKYVEWMDPGDLLMFSSDYPHWTFDDPSWAAKQFPDGAHDRIMYLNAINLHSLPQTVPALPD